MKSKLENHSMTKDIYINDQIPCARKEMRPPEKKIGNHLSNYIRLKVVEFMCIILGVLMFRITLPSIFLHINETISLIDPSNPIMVVGRLRRV